MINDKVLLTAIEKLQTYYKKNHYMHHTKIEGFACLDKTELEAIKLAIKYKFKQYKSRFEVIGFSSHDELVKNIKQLYFWNNEYLKIIINYLREFCSKNTIILNHFSTNLFGDRLTITDAYRFAYEKHLIKFCLFDALITVSYEKTLIGAPDEFINFIVTANIAASLNEFTGKFKSKQELTEGLTNLLQKIQI